MSSILFLLYFPFSSSAAYDHPILIFTGMALSYSQALIAVILAAILNYFIGQVLQWRRLVSLTSQNSCAKPSTTHTRWPAGLGRLIRILGIRGDVLENWLGADFRSHGFWTFAIEAPLVPTASIFTAEPANVQCMLAKNFGHWGLGPARAKKFGPFLGVGVFTADGDIWARSRAIVRPAFQRKQVSDLSATELHVSRLLGRLGGQPGEDGWTSPRNVMPYIYRFTLDNATQFLFGESVESQLQSDASETQASETQAFEEAFHTATTGVGLKMFIGPFYWIVDCRSAFRRACRLCKEYTVRFVDQALAVHAETKKEQEAPAPEDDEKNNAEKGKGIFLRTLVEATQDRTELRDQLMQLLFAGRDTTATLLSWSLLCFAHTPGAWDRLRTEILTMFGPGGDEGDELISFESLKGCTYLQNALRETLRMFPPIGVNGKQALCDTVLPTGGGADGSQPIAVAKGTPVLFTTYIMQRRPDIWGDDAHEWKPDRWVTGLRPGWSYIPFNGGPRHCPGGMLLYSIAASSRSADRIQNNSP